MANKKNIIMAWSECTVEMGITPDDGSMATSLTSVGTIKDKSSTLEPSEGDALEAKATGGKLVAKETLEGGFVFSTRVIEPSDELYTTLGIASLSTDSKELQVSTHVVSGYRSLKVTPKNVGAKGIKAPTCSVSFKPGWSEEEGNYVDLDFDILKGEADYWYSKFTKEASA